MRIVRAKNYATMSKLCLEILRLLYSRTRCSWQTLYPQCDNN